MGGGQKYNIIFYVLGLKVFGKICFINTQVFYLNTGDMGHSIYKYIQDELEKDGIKSRKLENLCRGLDNQSKTCVYRILSRLKEAHLRGSKICHTLTREEIEEQRRLHLEFFPNILQLSKKLFYYKYFFPINPCGEVSVHLH